MKVELARSAGFCYGVKRAVRMAEEAARSGKPCYMLGQIIHNDWEIRRLEALGLRLAAAPEEVPPGAAVIIRSHGEPRQVYQILEERGDHRRHLSQRLAHPPHCGRGGGGGAHSGDHRHPVSSRGPGHRRLVPERSCARRWGKIGKMAEE